MPDVYSFEVLSGYKIYGNTMNAFCNLATTMEKRQIYVSSDGFFLPSVKNEQTPVKNKISKYTQP